MAGRAVDDLEGTARATAPAQAVATAGEIVDVTVDGCRMRWRRFGAGRPLVLLHGGHGSWMHWIRNIDALAPGRMLLVPDMPGFGESDTLPGDAHDPQRLDRLVAMLGLALDTLVGPAAGLDLAAFSFGGTVAATLASRDRRVERLALLGSGGHGTRRRQHAALLDWRAVDGEARRERLRHNLHAFMLAAPASGPDAAAIDALALAVHSLACEQTRFRSKGISRRPVLEPALDRFDGPLLLLWGSEDPTADPASLAPALAGGGARRQWRVVDGAGHWLQFERPDEVNRLLAAFFVPL